MTDAVRLSKTSRPGKMSALRPPGMVFFPARAQGKLRGIFPQLRMAAMTLPPIAPLRGLKHWLYKLFLCGRSRQWPGSGDFSRNENERGSSFPCVLCTAVAYCCGAVAPRVTAALLGRFLPRLGPLASAGGPFSWHVLGTFLARAYSAAARYGRNSWSAMAASSSASVSRSLARRSNEAERSHRCSSI
jgi:hypothetical protein